MSLNRIISGAALGLLVFLAATPSFGENNLLGMQLFAPADLSTFGGPQAPNEGYFLSIEGLYWNISKPRTALIGDPSSKVVTGGIIQWIDSDGNYFWEPANFTETSTVDTSEMNSPFSWGQRYEFGRVENNNGWICSILRLDRAINGFEAYNSGVVLYDPVDPSTGYSRLYGFIGDGIITIPTTSPRDPNAIDFSETVLGNLPLVFDSMTVRTISDIWGVELSYLRRTMTFHNGGNLEFTFGARYLEFNEDFDVSTSGGVLNDNTYWNTHGQNHIIGPQFGARYNKQVGRWGVSADGRFTAGYNRQNISQDGNFGYTGATTSNMHPIAWPGQSFSSHVCFDEFSPLMELRLDLHYVLTRAINLRVGWTGFWAGGVVRPANVVEYQLPAMGIDASDNKENLFVNGVNFGIEFNR